MSPGLPAVVDPAAESALPHASPTTPLAGVRKHRNRCTKTIGTGVRKPPESAGKGRKQRATPLTATTIGVLRVWLDERRPAQDEPLFTTTVGRPLSRYAINVIIDCHLKTATATCPALATKKVTAHTLRHTAAMRLLHAGVDTTVIALWLGHESVETTQMYLHADLTLKERALSRTTPIGTLPGRYRPADDLLAFLEAL